MSAEAKCYQCKEVVNGFKTVCWTCLAEVESLRHALVALVAERPPCHAMPTGRCGSCDWCQAEQVLAASQKETQ